MTVTITDERMTSDLVENYAIKTDNGRWIITGVPFLGLPTGSYSRNQAITAMTLAEHLRTWGADHECWNVEAWRTELITPDLTPGYPSECTPPNTTTDPVRCLYCGSEEVVETLITIDERHSEYANECADCHGVWAQ